MAAILSTSAWSQSSSAAPAPKNQKPSATAATSGPAGPSTLTTEKDKISYAIGMNIGTQMRRQPIELDPRLVEKGLDDALAGRPTALTPEEAKAALTSAEGELRQKQQEKMQALAAANKQEGDAFLAANKTKPGVVTLADGLQYKILRAGTGPKPKLTDTVVCNYKGTLVNGTEFDSSYKRGKPVTVPVAHLIKGWTEALQLMPVGSQWRLFIPASLAYGPRAAGPDIGPNSTVIFDVELLSIAPPEAEPASAPGATKSGPPPAAPANAPAKD